MIKDNSTAGIKGHASELAAVLDEIAELQEQAKTIKAEAKLNGYDMKAFSQIVREMRRGHGYICEQLELELVLGAYRRAVGLPTTVEEAERLAREAVADISDAPSASSPKLARSLS